MRLASGNSSAFQSHEIATTSSTGAAVTWLLNARISVIEKMTAFAVGLCSLLRGTNSDGFAGTGSPSADVLGVSYCFEMERIDASPIAAEVIDLEVERNADSKQRQRHEVGTFGHALAPANAKSAVAASINTTGPSPASRLFANDLRPEAFIDGSPAEDTGGVGSNIAVLPSLVVSPAKAARYVWATAIYNGADH